MYFAKQMAHEHVACQAQVADLSSEAVQGASLALEGINHVHGGDSLPLGVLGVGNGVADHVLQEDLEDAPGLLVDEAGDPLDAATPRQAPDGWLSDSLGVPGWPQAPGPLAWPVPMRPGPGKDRLGHSK